MAKVKLGFSRLNVPAKIQQTRFIVTNMTGNTHYPTPIPTLAAITTAVNALETANEAASRGGKDKTAFMHVQKKALDALMVQLASYVQTASGGDPTIIFTSGMEVAATRTPPQGLPAPASLIATTGANEGQVVLKWPPVPGAKTYVVQQSADGSTNWTDAGHSTKATTIVGGLVSGSKGSFRVAAIGPKGQSPWSAATKAMAA